VESGPPSQLKHAGVPYDTREMAHPTVYDVLVAIDKTAGGKLQKCATRNEIADFLGVDADETSAEREPTLLLGQALEHSFIEEDFKSRGSWRLSIQGQGVLGHGDGVHKAEQQLNDFLSQARFLPVVHGMSCFRARIGPRYCGAHLVSPRVPAPRLRIDNTNRPTS
jgi:hypothetical protein